jgi:hypothetical protein
MKTRDSQFVYVTTLFFHLVESFSPPKIPAARHCIRAGVLWITVFIMVVFFCMFVLQEVGIAEEKMII